MDADALLAETARAVESLRAAVTAASSAVRSALDSSRQGHTQPGAAATSLALAALQRVDYVAPALDPLLSDVMLASRPLPSPTLREERRFG
jgi:hypothetical protein